ncbi:MAG: hypothetical protein LUQ38_06585 [Methanotrichaceae archaeon]|nr:hypothetical protein [Methanotrichaceae archaeon]
MTLGIKSFDGIFKGNIVGDHDSLALLTLVLAQKGNKVYGKATLGEGLKADTGGLVCPGLISIPPGSTEIIGEIDPQNPLQLETKSSYADSNVTVDINVKAYLSENGRSIDIQLDLKTPWPCRRSRFEALLNKSEEN